MGSTSGAPLRYDVNPSPSVVSLGSGHPPVVLWSRFHEMMSRTPKDTSFVNNHTLKTPVILKVTLPNTRAYKKPCAGNDGTSVADRPDQTESHLPQHMLGNQEHDRVFVRPLSMYWLPIRLTSYANRTKT